MKKVLSVFLAALMMISVVSLFAACSKDTAEKDTTGASDTAAAESDLAYVQDKGTLVVGITEYEPMNYMDENGEWTGFDTEFARAVGEKLGVNVEFVEINWDYKYNELDSKSIDCIWNGMTITDEGKEAASISDPYAENAQVVVMKQDQLANYTDVESLKDLTIAVEGGSA